MARILVIDDDPLVLSLATELLGARGHTVAVASDGSKGLRAFEKAPADLVVTDIVMPEQEGIATIRALRRLNPALPILAISGSPTSGRYGTYLDAAAMLGASATLLKPLQPDAFIKTVERLLPAKSV